MLDLTVKLSMAGLGSTLISIPVCTGALDIKVKLGDAECLPNMLWLLIKNTSTIKACNFILIVICFIVTKMKCLLFSLQHHNDKYHHIYCKVSSFFTKKRPLKLTTSKIAKREMTMSNREKIEKYFNLFL